MHKTLPTALVGISFLAILVVPLVVFSSSTFFPFIVGKNFAFRIAVEVMACAYVVLAVSDRRYRPQMSALLWTFLALLGVITVSAIFGENPEKSFWSNFERMEGVVTYVHLFAYFVVASTVLTVRKWWGMFWKAEIVVSLVVCAYAFLQWVGVIQIFPAGEFRLSATLGNSAYLGTYALFNAFLALWLFARTSIAEAKDKIFLGIYGFAGVFNVFVLYYTGTRGAMLGFLVGALVTGVLVALLEKKHYVWRRLAMAGLVLLVLLAAGFFAIRNTSLVTHSQVLSRFAAISLDEKTTKSRFMVWDMAYQGFKEHPILGFGMENFNYVFNKYYNPNMWEQEQWFDRAHNVFFDWLTAGGVLGLASYLSLFVFGIVLLWRKQAALSLLEKSILTGLLAGYFVQNLFVFDNITSLVLFCALLAYIQSLHASTHHAKAEKISDDALFALSGTMGIVALVLVFAVNAGGISQNTTLLRALSERTSEGAAHNLALFKEAIETDSYGTAEVREQLMQTTLNALAREKNPLALKSDFVRYAGEQIEEQALALPGDARYQLFAGEFFVRTGDVQKGALYLEKAHALSPKKQAILFKLGNTYYAQGNSVRAEALFKEAYELAPLYPQARDAYEKILTHTRNYTELERVIKDQILLHPDDADVRMKLAAFYLLLHRTDDARAEIMSTMDAIPAFKDQGEEYLRQISATSS